MAREVLDKYAAGELIKQRGETLKLTQEQVVEATTITVAAYLSELENGKVSVGRSKHFPSLAAALKLSEDDVRAINPSAIFNLEVAATPALPQSKPAEPSDFPLPDELHEAIALYGKRFPDLTDPRWQQFLASFRARGMEGDTPEDWLDLYRNMARHGIQPELKN